MFQSNGCVSVDSFLEVISPQVTKSMKVELVKRVTYEEVRKTTFGLEDLKACRFDGY